MDYFTQKPTSDKLILIKYDLAKLYFHLQIQII